MTVADYPERSQATLVLVFGIIGLFSCVFAPVAWYLGNQELRGVDAGRRSPEKRHLARVGRILGIVAVVTYGLLAVAIVAFVVFAVIDCADPASNCY